MTQFGEPTSIENAIVMLDAYKAELVKGGFEDQALQLKGLELFDASGAQLAIMTLESMPTVSKEADCIRGYVIRTLRELVGTKEQRLAS
jgi:hypothetical protein